jgi:hypothetical protein
MMSYFGHYPAEQSDYYLGNSSCYLYYGQSTESPLDQHNGKLVGNSPTRVLGLIDAHAFYRVCGTAGPNGSQNAVLRKNMNAHKTE